MKSVLIAGLAAVLVSGCSSSKVPSSPSIIDPATASGDVTMTMAFDPSPPKQGNETITITLTNARGDALKGATVTSTAKMPAMSMTGPALTYQDNGDGTYSAVTNMNYTTKWVFDVKATAGGKSSSAEFDQDAK